MKRSPLRKIYKNLVDSLSFSSELRKLRRELNMKIDMPETISSEPLSHPQGVNRWFKKRRVTIAESYLSVVKDLDSGRTRSRLEALKVLADVSLHSRNIDFPLNTARVHMALIKEVIKHRHSKRRQLELLHDFSVSSGGQYQVIRRLCDELNIIEVPESGEKLSTGGFGWDSHVHDSATSGRKNPTQLIIDAFIKGVSQLTIAYGSKSNLELMEESIEAGAILGIKVRIGLEFSMTAAGHRYHFMALLPELPDPAAARAFFADNAKKLGEFLDGLDRNQSSRIESVANLLEEFNGSRLRELNQGYPDDPLYRIPKLTTEGFYAFFQTASVNAMLLAEYMFSLCKPILLNRLLRAKMLRSRAREDALAARITREEAKAAEIAYSNLKKEYVKLTPEALRNRFFAGSSAIEYKSLFDDPRRVKAMLSSAGCSLEVLHPLEHGAEQARTLLQEFRGVIDGVEIYNSNDRMNRDISDIVDFALYVNDMNALSMKDGIPPFIPMCGSDSTGWNPKVPGMGFIYRDEIAGKLKSRYLGRHISLPPLVSAMIRAEGRPVAQEDVASAAPIIAMGKVTGWTGNALPDETDDSDRIVAPSRAIKYLNRKLADWIFVGVGFIVAQHFIGPAYALLWLGITGFRNSIADLVSGRGTRLSEWKLKSVNFDNVAQSMFWTGFSVPIMGFVKANFDLIWPLSPDGFLFNLVKFFFISGVNGLYLATHNTLRGFDKKVVRANLFRSVISWPFATVFAPLGNAIGIPSIVQAKIWSDVVAGFIEGGAKYLKILRLQLQNVEEIIPRFVSGQGSERFVALLDLLYLFRQEPRTRNSLKAIYDPGYRPMLILKSLRKADASIFHELNGAIHEDGIESKLVDYILSSFDSEMSADLIDLAADTLPVAREWITTQAEKLNRQRL